MPEVFPETGTPRAGDNGLHLRSSRPQVTSRAVLEVMLTALVLIGALYLLWLLRDIVRWCVIALFFAVALNPPVNWLNRHRLPRSLAILLVYLALFLFFVGLGVLVLPSLVDQVQELIIYFGTLFQQPGGLNQALQDLANRFGVGIYLDTLRNQFSALPSQLGAAVGPLLVVTRGVFSSITATLSILLITFFLLLNGDRFIEAGLNLIAAPQRARVYRLLKQSERAVSGYITGNLVISLIAGVAVFVVFGLLSFPFAVALALVVALFDLIPLIGATLGALIVLVVALFIDPVKAVILLVYFLVYQQIENNLLQPLVYGRSVHLHPLVVFLAVLIGGQLFGILGALLAIPIAEIIRILGADWLANRVRATGGRVHSAEEETPIDQVAADASDPRSSRTTQGTAPS